MLFFNKEQILPLWRQRLTDHDALIISYFQTLKKQKKIKWKAMNKKEQNSNKFETHT